MSYRAGIEARAREAAEAARDEVLHAELRGLENLLAFCRDEPIPDKQQIDEIRRTIKWARRQLRLPPSGEERRPSRPAEPEPEPIVEEPPNANICWHGRSRGGARAAAATTPTTCSSCSVPAGPTASAGSGPRRLLRRRRSSVTVRAVGRAGAIKAHEAVVEIADGRLVVARENDDRAAWTLRKLYPPARPNGRRADPLADLRAAMVAAHPDRGGSASDFIAARQKYVAARRRWRKV